MNGFRNAHKLADIVSLIDEYLIRLSLKAPRGEYIIQV